MRSFTKFLAKTTTFILLMASLFVVSNAQTNCVLISSTVNHVNCQSGTDGSINLQLTGGVEPYNVIWSYNGITDSYLYDLAAGTYTVSVTDANSCLSTLDVVVNEPDPMACVVNIDFSGVNYSETCNSRNFFADLKTACRPVALFWQFGDGNNAHDTLWSTSAYEYLNQMYEYASQGIYTASLTVTDLTLGGCVETVEYSVEIAEPIGATINISHEGLSRYQFSATVSGGSGSYNLNWNIDGYNFYNGVVNYVFQNTGWAYITLYLTDNINSGCQFSVTDSVEVTGIDPCLLFANLNKPTFMMSCFDVNFSVEVSNAGAQTGYDWNFGDGNSELGQNVNHTYAEGSYSYSLWITDTATSCQVELVDNISISTVTTNLDAMVNSSIVDFTISATGGSGTYYYEYMDFGDGFSEYSNKTNYTHTYANAGTYNAFAVVADQNNNYCKDTAYFEVVIGGFCDMVVNVGTITSASALENADGSIDIIVNGGTPPYTFNWSNNTYDEDPMSLNTGTYYVTITDMGSCNKVYEYFVPYNATGCNMYADVYPTNPMVVGGSDGSIMVVAYGGTMPYTYNHIGYGNLAYNSDTAYVYNLTAGHYEIEVIDANACADTVKIDLVDPCALYFVTDTIHPASGPMMNDGFIGLHGEGGVPPYQYSMDGVNFTGIGNFMDLYPGDYTIYIKDYNNCQSSQIFTIGVDAPVCMLYAEAISTNPSLVNEPDGIVVVKVFNGTSPYQYTQVPQEPFSFPGDSAVFSGLMAGPYVFVVTDNTGCTDSVEVELFNPCLVYMVADSVIPASTSMASDGAIYLHAEGGEPVYEFSLDGGITYSTNPNFLNLIPGDYTIRVRDAYGCLADANITVGYNQTACPFSLNISSVNPDAGQSNGSITVQVIGSPYFYDYSIDGGVTFVRDTSQNKVFNNLSQGTYSIAVKNSEECMLTDVVTLTEQETCNINYDISQVNPTAAASYDGSITINVTSGPGTMYEYFLNGTPYGLQGMNYTFADLGEGAYYVSIKYDQNCEVSTASIVLTVGGGGCDYVADFLPVNPSQGNSDGGITVNITGGASSQYFYTLGMDTVLAGVSYTFNGLPADNYNITVKDYVNLCPYYLSVTLVEQEGCSMTASETHVNPTVAEPNLGSISVITSNGTAGTYTYTLNGMQVEYDGPGHTFDSLPEGYYIIVVSDVNGCEAQVEVDLVTESNCPFTLSYTAISPDPASENGSITIVVTGPAGMYDYSIDEGAVYITDTTGHSFMNLMAGQYHFLVRDEGGCIRDIYVDLLEVEIADVYMFGPATPLAGQESLGQMNPGVVEDLEGNPISRPGMFEKYMYLTTDAGGFNIKKVVNGVDFIYGLQQSETVYIDGFGSQIIGNVERGTIIEGNTPFTVPSNGLYHVVMDFESMTYHIVPVTVFSMRGDAVPCGWGGDMTLTQTISNSDTVQFEIPYLALTAGQFKFRYQNGWKVMVDTVNGLQLANHFSFYSNFGGDFGTMNPTFVAGGPNYIVAPEYAGTYLVKLIWTLQGGFEAKFENPCVFDFEGVISDASSNQTNGSIDITVAGNGTFTYAWSNGANSEDLANLGTGKYNLTVTDIGSGCFLEKSFYVSGTWAGLSPYLMGPSIAAQDMSGAGLMDNYGREGLFEKYISYSTSGSGFMFITEYYGTQIQYGPVTNEMTGIIGDGGFPVSGVKRGKLGQNPAKFFLPQNGFYHVVIDMVTMTYLIVPVNQIGIAGDIIPGGTWSNDIDLNINPGMTTVNDVEFNVSDVTINSGSFKFRHGHMWTYTPDALFLEAGAINSYWFHTNFGGMFNGGLPDFIPGGDNYEVPADFAGVYDIKIRWNSETGFNAEFTPKNGCNLSFWTHVADYSVPNSWDGKLDVWPQTGSGNYTFLWDDGYYPNHREGLGARTYQLTVTDNETGCVGTTSLEVKDGPVYISYSHSVTSCSEFTASTSVTGGDGNYNYAWWVESNQFNTPSIGFTATENKNHIVELTVADQSGNFSRFFEFIPLVGTVPEVQMTVNDRQVAFEIPGIAPADYNFTWSMGDGQTWEFSNLVSHEYSDYGTYNVAVVISSKTNANCVFTLNQEVVLTNPCPLSAIETLVNPSGDTNTGSITLSVMGGTGFYSFNWYDGVSTQNRENLWAGSYTVEITDTILKCSITKSFTLTAPVYEVYILGPSTTGYDYFDYYNRMKALPRSGNYELYMTLIGGEGFRFGVNNNGTNLYFGLSENEYTQLSGDNGFMNDVQRGRLQMGDSLIPVSQNGFYYITIDIQTMTYALIPVQHMGLVGNSVGGGGWYNDMVFEKSQTDPYSIVFKLKNVRLNESAGSDPGFKFRMNNSWGWAMDSAFTNGNLYWVGTNFGGNFMYTPSLVTDGPNFQLAQHEAGMYNLNVSWSYYGGFSAQFNKVSDCTYAVNEQIIKPDYEQSNGSIVLTVNGSTGPYEFIWSNNQMGSELYGLAPGNYNVSVKDNMGCETNLYFLLEENTPCIRPELGISFMSCEQVQFNAYNNGGYFEGEIGYQWMLDGNQVNTTNYWFDTTLVPGNHNIQVWLTAIDDPNGCVMYKSKEFVVYPNINPQMVVNLNGNRGEFSVGNLGNLEEYDFYWDFRDGNYAYTPNVIHYFPGISDYNVYLSVTHKNNTSCTYYKDSVFTVSSILPCNLTADISYTEGFNRNVTLTATNLYNPEVEVYWYKDGYYLGSGLSLNYQFDSAGVFPILVELVAHYDNQCRDSIYYNVNVEDIPCNLTTSLSSVNGTMQFNTSGGTGLYNYYLSMQTGPYFSYNYYEKDAFFETELIPNGLYYVQVSDMGGCVFSFYHYHVQNGNAYFIDFNMPGISGCAPQNLHFENTSVAGTQFVTYKWMVDGMAYYSQHLDANFMGGHHNVQLLAYDQNGIEVGRTGRDFSLDGFSGHIETNLGTEICPGSRLSMWVNSNVNQVNWMVNGISFTGRDINYTFESVGTYPVFVEVWDNCGYFTHEFVVTVTPNAIPTAVIMANTGQSCPNDKIQFNAHQGFSSYYWQFGDGDVSNLREPQHQYTNIGTYMVTLKVGNSCGGFDTDTMYININGDVMANAEFNYPMETQCPMSPVQFWGNSNGNYYWQFGDGTISLERNPIHYFQNPGIYDVSLRFSNGCGYQATKMHSVYIDYLGGENVYPEMVFDHFPETMDSLTVCPGSFVRFENKTESQMGSNQAQWLVNDVIVSYNYNLEYTFQNEGMNIVKLRYFNPCNSSYNEAVRYVVVSSGALPLAQLKTVPDTLCLNEKVLFFDEMHEGFEQYTYTVDFGDGSPVVDNITELTGPFEVVAEHVYTSLGNFVAVMTATNSCGNTITRNFPIVVDNSGTHQPFFYISNSTMSDNPYAGKDLYLYTFAPESIFFLTLDSLNNYRMGMVKSKYDSNPNIIAEGQFDVVDSTNLVTFYPGELGCQTDGEYNYQFNDTLNTLTFNVINDACTNRLSIIDGLPLYLEEEANESESTPAACPGDLVEFGAFGGIDYEWNFGDGSDPEYGPFVAHAYTNPGMYNAFVVVTSGCGGTDTLHTVATVDINSMPNVEFWFDNNENVYAGDVVNLHVGNSDDTGSTLYQWSFDDGGYLEGSDVNYIFNTPGWHYVTLTATNGCGTNSYTRDIYIKEQEVITCSASFNYFIDPETQEVQFMAQTSGNITSYSWNFGDNFTSDAVNPSHMYSQPGYYNVCLYVFDGANNCYADFCSVVQIMDETVACHSYFTYVAENLTVSFNNKATGGPTIFQWSFGDGTGSNLASPVKAYQYPGTYEVCLIVKSNDATCYDRYCTVIEVIDQEQECNVNFNYTISNKTVTFNNTSSDVSSYQWSFGNGMTSSLKNPVYTYAQGGYYDVCLSIYDNVTGCQGSLCKTIYIVDTTGTYCNADYSYVIDEGTVSFVNESVGTGLQYYWQFGDGSVSSMASPSHTYTSSGYFNVCLKVNNSVTGCNDEYCSTIQIILDTIVPCQANYTYFVEGSEVFFTSTSLGEITNLLWNFGDGTYSTQANPSHTYAAPDFYNVCLTVYNSESGCMDKKCKFVMAIDENIPVLNANFDFFASNLDVTFTDQTEGEPTSYLWDFGDGSYSTQANPSHHFDETGFYNVCLSVYDEENELFDDNCQMVMVFDTTPEVVLNASFDYFISGTTITFSNASQGNVTNYLWDFGDGQYSADENPAHTFNGTNYYQICLSVYDAAEGDIDEFCEYILVLDTVGTACRAQFGYMPISGTSISFTAQTQGSITDYFWDFGDGDYAYEQNPQHTYYSPDFYWVCLKVFDSNSGCMDEYCNFITVIDSTASMCNAEFTSMTNNKEAYFTSTSSGNITNYFWDFGDGNYAYEANPTHTYMSPNYYEVYLSVYDNVSGCVDEISQYVVIVDSTAFLCKADFDYYVNNKVANFTARVNGNVSNYFWDFGDGSYAYEANPTHTYNYPGVYDVWLNIYDVATGCMDYKDKYVVVIDSTAFLCNAKFTSYNQNRQVTFTNNSTGNADFYFWNFGDGWYDYTADATHTYAEPGYYEVYLSIYNSANGCMDDVTNVVVVTDTSATAMCNARFSYYPEGDQIFFQSNSIGDFSQIFWDFDDGSNSNQNNPVHAFANPGYYNVCLTIIDTLNGCFDTRCQVVYVEGEVAVEVVKANFSYLPSADSLKVKYTDLSYGSPDLWYWSFGDNTEASLIQNPEHIFTDSGYFRTCLTVQNAASQNTKCAFVAVGDVSNSVAAFFNYFADSVTSTGHFRDKSLGNVVSYLWNFGDGYTSQQKNPSHTYQTTGYYGVCLTVTNANGVTSQFCEDVRIGNALENPCLFSCVWPGDANNDLEANHYDIMTIGLNYDMAGPRRENGTIDWYGQFAQNWSTYQANGVNNKHGDCNGDGVINMADTLAINQNFAFSHYYTPDVLKNADWELNCIWEPITTKASSRKAAAKLSPPSGKEGNEIYAIGYEIEVVNGEGIIFSGITINFGDSWIGEQGENMLTVVKLDSVEQKILVGMTRIDHQNVAGSGEIAEINFPLLPGFDGSNVTFRVYTLGGIENTGSPLVVGQGFTINLGANVEICQGETATLAVAEGFQTYTWSTGATDTNQVVVNTSGLYYVTVTNDGLTRVDSVLVTVHDLPVIALDDNYAICENENQTLDAGAGFEDYIWSNGDTTQTITVATAGNYSVTVTNSFGCVNTSQTALVVNDLPVVDLGDNQQICTGSTGTIDAGAGFASYEWSNGTDEQTITVSEAGMYYVTVSNEFGCEDIDSIGVSLLELPVVDLGDNLDLCFGESHTIDAGAGFESYIWNNEATTQTINVNLSGNYIVSVEGANGCFNSDSVIVFVHDLPVVNLGTDFSQPDSATLDAGAGYETYLWSTGETTQTIKVYESGEYWVLVTNAFNCEGSDTVSVTITAITEYVAIGKVNIYPNPSRGVFTLELDSEFAESTVVELYNNQGQLIMNREYLRASSIKEKIDMLGETGIFNLRIIKGDKVRNYKVVVE